MSKEPEPRAPRRTPRRAIDWQHAAELLAQGMTIAAVAGRVGCARATLARKRRHDLEFQSWMARCRPLGREATPDWPMDDDQAEPSLADLRVTLQQAIEKEVRAGNIRVVLWLADRLKLVTPPSERTPEQELRDILGSLTSEELQEFEGLRDTP